MWNVVRTSKVQKPTKSRAFFQQTPQRTRLNLAFKSMQSHSEIPTNNRRRGRTAHIRLYQFASIAVLHAATAIIIKKIILKYELGGTESSVALIVWLNRWFRMHRLWLLLIHSLTLYNCTHGLIVPGDVSSNPCWHAVNTRGIYWTVSTYNKFLLRPRRSSCKTVEILPRDFNTCGDACRFSARQCVSSLSILRFARMSVGCTLDRGCSPLHKYLYDICICVRNFN